MSLFGTSIAQSIVGASQAERTAIRDSERKHAARINPARRAEDEVELDSAQTADAVRNLKDNTQEETAEERAEQDRYRPAKGSSASGAPKHIDVQG